MSYIPTQNFCGIDMFTYDIEDDMGAQSSSATVVLNISCVNDLPSVTNLNWTLTGNILTQSGYVLSEFLLANDVDGDMMQYSIVSLPQFGVINLSSSGAFTYVPNLGFSGTESFTFQSTDGMAISNIATGTITVLQNTYLPPAITVTGVTLMILEDIKINQSIASVSGSTWIYTLATSPLHGVASLSTTGVLIYNPLSH
jgi:hypothetical protein